MELCKRTFQFEEELVFALMCYFPTKAQSPQMQTFHSFTEYTEGIQKYCQIVIPYFSWVTYYARIRECPPLQVDDLNQNIWVVSLL